MCILYIIIINYILCTTLHYPAQNDCATLFHQSVCSICVMLSDSFHFHTTLHYPTLLYATVHCSTLLCTALGYLHYSTPLYTSLQSTPLCILLSPPPQRRDVEAAAYRSTSECFRSASGPARKQSFCYTLFFVPLGGAFWNCCRHAMWVCIGAPEYALQRIRVRTRIGRITDILRIP